MPGLPKPPTAPSEGTLPQPPVSNGPKGVSPPVGSTEIVQPDGTTTSTGYALYAGSNIVLTPRGNGAEIAVNGSGLVTYPITTAQGGTGLTSTGADGNLLIASGGVWIAESFPSLIPPGANGNVLTSDGAGHWASQTPAAGGISGSALAWSYVDWWTTKQVIDGTNYVWTVGSDQTVGISFYALASGLVISGVRFIYLPSDHNPRTIKFGLIDMTTGTRIDNVSSALVDGQTGTLNFPSSHTLVQGHQYAVVGYSTAGGLAYPTDAVHTNNGPDWTQTTGGQNQNVLWRVDGKIYILQPGIVFGAGDTNSVHPTFVTKNNLCGVEPVFSA